jgi:hypothetical protein
LNEARGREARLVAPIHRAEPELRWHDLRGTRATWLSVANKPIAEIRRTIGHATEAQTEEYVRNADLVRGWDFGEPFPALPRSLLARPISAVIPVSAGAPLNHRNH